MAGELTDLLFVEVSDRVTVDGAVAVLGEVADGGLASVAGADDEAVLVVGDEVVQHAADAGSRVTGGHVVTLGFGVDREQRVDDRFDLDYVVADLEFLGDAFGVAHVLVAADRRREDEAVDVLCPERLDGQVARERAVDPRARARPVGTRGVDAVADELEDVFASSFQFLLRSEGRSSTVDTVCLS